MSDDTLLMKPALELAAGVRTGKWSARELTELALARYERFEPELNAFTMVDAERALAAADAVRPDDPRPFAGVPTAIKDLGAMLEGYPFTCASDLFGDFVAPLDSSVVTRIKQAGFVIVGKTNLPECGILCVSESRRFGAVRNPWDTSRTPGGSSGGAAAAVAAGMLPLAHGSDGAGSLRIPAACCGLVGLKASRNRISHAPLLGDSPLVTDGFVTRTVADAAATLDVLAGYEPGDANWAPPPADTFLEAAGRDPGRLRIAWSTHPWADVPVIDEHCAMVEQTAELLEGLGHEVEQFDPPFDPTLLETFTDLWTVGIASLVGAGSQIAGRAVAGDTVEPLTLEFWERAQGISALDLMHTDNTLKAFARRMVSELAPYDALITPVLNLRPVEIGWIDSADGMEAFDRSVRFTAFTATTNLAGLPAISLPLGELSADGMPGSVQLVGRPAGEQGLLSLAAQLERTRPFAHLHPPAFS